MYLPTLGVGRPCERIEAAEATVRATHVAMSQAIVEVLAEDEEGGREPLSS